MAGSERDDLIALAQKKWVRLHHERIAMLFNDGNKGLIELAFGPRFDDNKFLSQRISSCSHIARIETRNGIVWIYKKSNCVRPRRELMQYFELFGHECFA